MGTLLHDASYALPQWVGGRPLADMDVVFVVWHASAVSGEHHHRNYLQGRCMNRAVKIGLQHMFKL